MIRPEALVTLAIGAALAFGAFLFARRYGGGAALEQLERANRILEGRVHELERENVRLTQEVASLHSRTDVSLAIEPVLIALRLHETEAAKRSEATLHVLSLIAERIGPDGERQSVPGS